VPKEEIMLQAIVLLLVMGAMFVSVLLGLVFVVRAVIRQTARKTAHSTTVHKWSMRVNPIYIGLAIGIAIPTVLKIRLGEWEWLDMVRIIAFGLTGACFGGLIEWVSAKLQKAFQRE
jgi:hypothetical protein